MGEKETSGPDLAKLYQGGATLTEIAAEKGLGRFGVAYRLKKAGVERRNRGTPQKTAAEKGDFARQQLKATFGEAWPKVMSDLQTGTVAARDLAAQNNIKDSTFRTWLTRAAVATPKREVDHRPAEKPAPRITILDLVDPADFQMAGQILGTFSKERLDPQKVAAATAQQLKILGFTPKEITYMRGQLKKRETGS